MLKLPNINLISIDAHFVPYTKELLKVTSLLGKRVLSHNENCSLDEKKMCNVISINWHRLCSQFGRGEARTV